MTSPPWGACACPSVGWSIAHEQLQGQAETGTWPARHAGVGSGSTHTLTVMLDGILVRESARISATAFRQQVSQGLVVHLNVGSQQLILPALALKQLHLLQDLHPTHRCML